MFREVDGDVNKTGQAPVPWCPYLCTQKNLVNSSDEAQNLRILQINHLLFPRIHTKGSCAFRLCLTPAMNLFL